jgi:xylan 1,4-beta-xylosidase
MSPNPLISGFNPDPSITLADGAYYLVTSTFEYLPGIPVYRSTDLVTWTHIGNVATRPEQVSVETVPTGGASGRRPSGITTASSMSSSPSR